MTILPAYVDRKPLYDISSDEQLRPPVNKLTDMNKMIMTIFNCVGRLLRLNAICLCSAEKMNGSKAEWRSSVFVLTIMNFVYPVLRFSRLFFVWLRRMVVSCRVFSSFGITSDARRARRASPQTEMPQDIYVQCGHVAEVRSVTFLLNGNSPNKFFPWPLLTFSVAESWKRVNCRLWLLNANTTWTDVTTYNNVFDS